MVKRGKRSYRNPTASPYQPMMIKTTTLIMVNQRRPNRTITSANLKPCCLVTRQPVSLRIIELSARLWELIIQQQIEHYHPHLEGNRGKSHLWSSVITHIRAVKAQIWRLSTSEMLPRWIIRIQQTSKPVLIIQKLRSLANLHLLCSYRNNNNTRPSWLKIRKTLIG